MTAKPPVQCGNCGAEITFASGQLVGHPDAVARVERALGALREIDRRGHQGATLEEHKLAEIARKGLSTTP